jgi:hypothetical protein
MLKHYNCLAGEEIASSFIILGSMSRTSLFAFLLVLFGCNSRPASNDEAISTASTPISSPPSAKTVDASGIDPVSTEGNHLTPDSSLYIGEISTFPETGELYTPLYYHEGVDTGNLYESLPEQTDSVIYDDGEIKRSRLPITLARSYLNLTGLDTVSVFEKGRLACKAGLVRVEYFDDMIETQFIAVFKPLDSSSLPEQPDYCISLGRNPFESVDISYDYFEDEQLTKNLLATFGPGTQRVWHVSHTRVLPYKSIYSAISFESRLLLIETHNGQSRILQDLNNDLSVLAIIPIHLQSNGKPILLLRMVVNETDIMYTGLAIYSGKEYVIMDRNRVEESVISNQ